MRVISLLLLVRITNILAQLQNASLDLSMQEWADKEVKYLLSELQKIIENKT